jgi:hypothetical protein
MRRWTWLQACMQQNKPSSRRLLTDGGENTDEESDEAPDDASDADRSNVEVTEAGEAEPADPKWEKPDLDDIPEFEIRADEPVAGGQVESNSDPNETQSEDPTAGMPNTARTPGASRIKKEGTEGYIAALELCARLPDDVRLPEEAADLVPAAVEAELEQDIQSFAAAEFDNQHPHVETLAFEEIDDEVWLRLRLGVPPDAFSELDPEEIQTYALEQLEGVF